MCIIDICIYVGRRSTYILDVCTYIIDTCIYVHQHMRTHIRNSFLIYVYTCCIFPVRGHLWNKSWVMSSWFKSSVRASVMTSRLDLMSWGRASSCQSASTCCTPFHRVTDVTVLFCGSSLTHCRDNFFFLLLYQYFHEHSTILYNVVLSSSGRALRRARPSWYINIVHCNLVEGRVALEHCSIHCSLV